MRQDIKIKEGGVARTFGGLNKLIVPLSTGGESQWIPKASVDAPDKSVDKNGTYKASTDGVYGWAQVTVNVQQSDHITGTGSDGNPYTVSVDDDGNLVEQKLPTLIQVTTPPTRLLYTDGDTIDFSGIVVTAYDIDGNSMGEVPFSELQFSDHTAVNDGNTYTNGAGVMAMYVNCATAVYSIDWQGQEHLDGWIFPGGLGVDEQGRTNTAICLYMYEPGGYMLTQYNGNTYGVCKYGTPNLYSARDEGDRWYYWGGSFGHMNTTEFLPGANANELHWETLPESTSDPEGVSIDDLYVRDIAQTILVEWARPGDGYVLISSFVITVQAGN